MTKQIDEIIEGTGLPQKAFANADDQVRIRTDRFSQIYANNMRVNISSWDLGITFGEIVGEKDGQPVIEETVRVLMTREIAKILAILLKNHIDVFEAQFGEVKIPFSSEAGEGKTAASTSQEEPPALKE